MTHTAAYLAAFTLTLSISHCPHTLLAQSASPAVPGVAGSWKVSLHGQHIIPVGMELKQDGRVVLRASGTEPVIRVMLEGRDENVIRLHAERLAQIVRNAAAA